MVREGNVQIAVHDAVRTLGAASEQIELALKDSQPSVDMLGESLARLAELLGEDMTTIAGQKKMAALRAEMLRAVAGLQFYDRMTQHLTHVRDYLANSAAQASVSPDDVGELWDDPRQKLSDRLLSETHRMHLGKNFVADYLKNGGIKSREERGASSPGDVDLF